jgi:hypothetical protein
MIMSLGFLNALMLLGLAGVLIPPVIHLLNRRRFDVVEWGAMQFLQVSQTTRRRLRLEEVLLMLLRMGLIALLVLALAAPYASGPALAKLGTGPNRDVVLVFDGSYSMGFTGTGQSAHDAAREWAAAFLDELAAGDSVAILQAKQAVVRVLEPTHDLESAREALARLPSPRGGGDWSQALQAAHQLLSASQRPQREIIVLGDGQRFGWADEASLLRWELLAGQVREPAALRPRIRVVNLDPHRTAQPPNWSLAPLRASRAVASVGQEITFRTALERHGRQEYRPPHRLRLEVDGLPVTDLKPPTAAPLGKGQVPLSFGHRFTTPGSHLVSILVEPDPPPEQRPPGYAVQDHLPGDNGQDLAIEVLPALPVLLVDGDTRPVPKTRGTDFLRDALSPARDPAPVVRARVVPIQDFDPALLRAEGAKEPGGKPRVLVLSNVPRLTLEQQEAVAQFLAEGGGVLVTLGERVEADHYNTQLYRDGQGWLPARLETVAGDEAQPEKAASPSPASFFHPAVDLFREAVAGGLGDARFPRWWQVATPGRGSAAVPVALLTSNDPFLVERPHRSGRVLLCTVPLDASWRARLVNLPAFAPLAHELVYYLAGVRSAEYNLQPGQPLRYRPPGDEPAGAVVVQTPAGESQSLPVSRWPLVYEHTQETGVYRLKTASGASVYYVVAPDHRESDLTACSDADREKVAKLVPMTYEPAPGDPAESSSSSAQSQELWWGGLFGVLALLCGEVWLTRRLVKNRELPR